MESLQAHLSNVGKDKNTQTGEELFKAVIKLTKKQSEDSGMPQVSLTIKDPSESRLSELLDSGEIVIKLN